MIANSELRVPLHEVQGVPTFLTRDALQQWLAEHDVEVREDWAGRESVDLETAWRLKNAHDVELAKAAEERRTDPAKRTPSRPGATRGVRLGSGTSIRLGVS